MREEIRKVKGKMVEMRKELEEWKRFEEEWKKEKLGWLKKLKELDDLKEEFRKYRNDMKKERKERGKGMRLKRGEDQIGLFQETDKSDWGKVVEIESVKRREEEEAVCDRIKSLERNAKKRKREERKKEYNN